MNAPAGSLALARVELGGALRFALLLGGLGALGGFAVLALKLSVFSLVLPTGNLGTLAGIVAGFVLGAALLAALEGLRELVLLAAAHRLARRLGPAVLQAGSGDGGVRAAAALADVETLRRGVAGPLAGAALDAAVVPLGLVALWLVHWAFGAFALACCLLAGLNSLLAERTTRAALLAANHAAARTTATVADALRCAEAVAAMGMLPALLRRWQGGLTQGAAGLAAARAAARRAGLFGATVQSLAGGGALLLGAGLILDGADLGLGLLLALLLTGRLVEPFGRLGGLLQEATELRAAWQRLGESLAAAPPPAAAFPCPAGGLRVERLSALTPGAARPLLRDVGLVLAPGDVVAVSGPSGSGKSTLLRLVLGLARPLAGAAYLDGHATWQWDRADLARHVGWLPQEAGLTEGSIAEAIARLGAPHWPTVLAAARLAGAHRLIVGLPRGYATPVGPDGGLSMGQRQRIALARAVYGTPRLVLLDEPATWLDAEGEAAVLRLLATLKARRVAVLFSAHQPALLAAADRVLLLAGGALVPRDGAQRLLAA